MGTKLEDRPATDIPDQQETVDESSPLSRFLDRGGTTGAPASPGYLGVAAQVAEIIGTDDISEAAVAEHVRRMGEEKLPWENQLKETLRTERNPRLQEVLRPRYRTNIPERLRERTTHAWMDVLGPAVCQVEIAGQQAASPGPSAQSAA